MLDTMPNGRIIGFVVSAEHLPDPSGTGIREENIMALQTYRQVVESTDQFELLEHCKNAVEENNEINDAKYEDWDDGHHVVETYLNDNQYIKDDPGAYRFIVEELNDWLALSQATQESKP